jgi:His/Glu/Gln/Arg/opine family amino acid ABC transporter permease subunit
MLSSARALGLAGTIVLLVSACSGTAATPGPSAPTSASAAATLAAPDRIKTAGNLVFCTDVSFAPQEFYAADGTTAQGSDIDIAGRIAAYWGVTAEVDNTPFDVIILALQARKCDLVISGMNVTAKRQEQVDFVDYLKVGQGLLVLAGNPQGIHTLEDLSGKSVAVQLGTTNLDALTAKSDELKAAGKAPIDIKGYQKDTDAFSQLGLRRVDAYSTDSPVVAYYTSLPDNAGKFEVGGTPIDPQPVGIAMRKDDAGMKAAVQTAIDTMHADGSMQAIVDKWGITKGVVQPSSPPADKGARMGFDPKEFFDFTFTWRTVLLGALVTTVLMAVLAQVLGILLGLLAALGSRSRNMVIKRVSGLYVWIFRGTPVLVQIALLYYGVPALLGIDPFPKQYGNLPELIGGAFLAATLALGINEGAYMSEIIRAGILSVDPGQAEAAKSLGMTPGKTMSRIVLPQAMRVIVPPLGNEFNNMLKTTSLASVVGVTELLLLAQNRYGGTFKPFEPLIGICVYYLLLTTLWGFVQGRIEKKFGTGLTRNEPDKGTLSRLTGIGRKAGQNGGIR